VLDELATHSPLIRSILVVDNGSAYSVADAVARSPHAAKVRVVRLPKNEGSAGGFSEALRAALEEGTRFIWLLDDDNRPQVRALDRLLAAFSMLGEPEDALFLSLRPDRYRYDRAVRQGTPVAFDRNSFQGLSVANIPAKVTSRFTSGGSASSQDAFRFPCVEIDVAPYGGLLLQSTHVERFGLPDVRFFMYLDDYEYTSRLRTNGCRIYLCATSQIQDIDESWSVTTPGALMMFNPASPDRLVYFAVRNQTFLERNQASSPPLYFLNLAVVFVGLSAVSLVKFGPRRLGARLRLMARAISDGLRGELGPGPFGI
jgi:glycosyltransferase involved in cell wall biosynthesis